MSQGLAVANRLLHFGNHSQQLCANAAFGNNGVRAFGKGGIPAGRLETGDGPFQTMRTGGRPPMLNFLQRRLGLTRRWKVNPGAASHRNSAKFWIC